MAGRADGDGALEPAAIAQLGEVEVATLAEVSTDVDDLAAAGAVAPVARVALTSLWLRVADLPLVVEGCATETLAPGPEFAEEMHSTRLVRLSGAGEEGRSEDITLFFGAAPELALTGEWTLGASPSTSRGWSSGSSRRSGSRRGAGATGATRRPRSISRSRRRASRCTRRSASSRGRSRSSTRWAWATRRASTRSCAGSSAVPDLRFKLDAARDWTPEIAGGAGGHRAPSTRSTSRAAMAWRSRTPTRSRPMYELVLAAFPDALLEDPHDLPEITPLVAPHAARVSYDAPIHTVADLDALSLPARTINVKPCRVGTLRDLFALYAACEERGLALYGGGMGELGVGRGQVQLLASLFHPDGPNDIAPPGYNALDPAPGLPRSPLAPQPVPAGFGRQPDT